MGHPIGEAEDFEGGQAELAAGGDGEGLKRSKSSRGWSGSRGMSSVQWSRPGLATGAVTTRKFLPVSLTRM